MSDDVLITLDFSAPNLGRAMAMAQEHLAAIAPGRRWSIEYHGRPQINVGRVGTGEPVVQYLNGVDWTVEARIIPGPAGGGPMPGGKLFVTGEHGPETFTPSTAGRVDPMRARVEPRPRPSVPEAEPWHPIQRLKAWWKFAR